MEKEPRLSRRGLDCETLPTLKTPGPDNIPTTTSAHTAKETVHLLILAVMRLERALQRIHPLPYYPRKAHAELYRRNGRPSSQAPFGSPSKPATCGCPWPIPSWDNYRAHSRQPCGHSFLWRFRASFARLSSNMAVHKSTHSLYAHSFCLGRTAHMFSTSWTKLFRVSRSFSPSSGGICG
jgi:hypothetical protein